MIDILITPEHLENMFDECGYSYTENAMLLSEEMSELNKEIMKFKRFWCAGAICFSERKDAIAEEMAHVYICMEAIKRLIGIRDIDIQEKIWEKERNWTTKIEQNSGENEKKNG